MSYERTSLGTMPLVLETQTVGVRPSVQIPTHPLTQGALDAVRQAQVNRSVANPLPIAAPRPLFSPIYLTGEGRGWLLHYTIWGAIACGLGLVGYGIYRILRTGRLFSNPDWRIEWAEVADLKGKDAGFGVVLVGNTETGGVMNTATPGRRERWEASDERQRAMPGEHPTPEAAAAAVYEEWVSKQVKPQAPPSKPKARSGKIDIAVPDWVTGVTVEEVEEGVHDRLAVRLDGKIVGFLHGSGNTWEAHAIIIDPKTEEVRKILLRTTSRKYGIAAIYASAKIRKFLAGSFERGTRLHHTKEVYKKLPPLEPFGPHRYVERFIRAKHYEVVPAENISRETGVPVDEIIDIGLMLAKTNVIYGAVSRERITTFEKQEEAWDKPGQRESIYGPMPRKPSKQRRIIGTKDIPKLRKAAKEIEKLREKGLISEASRSVLLPSIDKDKIPRVRTVNKYSFAMIGPGNVVGYFDRRGTKIEEW